MLLPFDAMAAGPEEEEERRPPAGLSDTDDRYLFLRLTKDGGLREGGQKYVSDGVLRNCL